MRRLTLLAIVLSLALAVVLPASADFDDVSGCTASTGLSVQPLSAASAPACEFQLVCFNVCFYTVAIDVSGTGQVLGNLFVGDIDDDPSDTDGSFINFSTGDPAPNPSCGPTLFGCGFRTQPVTPTVLQVVQGIVGMFCEGGGIAAFESVTCSVTEISGGPIS